MEKTASHLKCERLERVARIITDLQINEEHRENLRVSMQYLRSMQHGKKAQRPDHIAEGLAIIDSIDAHIIRETAELEEEKRRILEEIQRLAKPEYAEVLYLRYVELLSWEKVADKMCYSRRYTLSIHKAALEEFARLDTAG